MDLKEFLVSQKGSDVGHVVVGNRAGDADSIVSALTLAYIDSVFGGKPRTPVVSITRNDLETQRPEVSFLFRTLGLESAMDSIRFVDDPVVVSPPDDKKVPLTLVDHNRAEDVFRSSDCWQVVEIVDHHYDEQQHLQTCPAGNDRQIAFENDKSKAASTCTVVAERLKALTKPKYDSTLATLLLGTILLDSVNMIPAAGKGTPRDAAAIQDLLDNTDWSTVSKEAVSAWFGSDSRPDTTKLFESLQAAKFDPEFWHGLSVQDALRLDYKSFKASTSVTFGASAILMPMTDFLKKPDIVHGIIQYMQVASVDFLAILFFSTSGGERGRQLILCGIPGSDTGKLIEEMAQFLIKEGTLDLKEVEDGACMGDNTKLTLKLNKQQNVKASRKQVAPLLIQFFESQ